MAALRRFFGLFRDSPTYGRDRANLVSGFTIGIAGLILNFAVLSLAAPLIVAPDDSDVRYFTENIEVGQLLALILLGGATAFATLLIPLRLVAVFWGPRMSRYFDQIVLSGISPLRFLIGKAMSQNLFLALIMFLLLPYLALSLTLGGVEPLQFLGGLMLVWLYSMMIALLMLWVSLYLNELLAAIAVIFLCVVLSVLGCLPIGPQPFVFTPFPTLLQPVYASLPDFSDFAATSYRNTFLTSAGGMLTVCGLALVAIYLGPLYGIVRDNSMFGEVVRAGDSRKKRWIRLRLHIQRPSELAFFYANRDTALKRHEGLIRWITALGGVVAVIAIAHVIHVRVQTASIPVAARNGWFSAYDKQLTHLIIHALGLVVGSYVLSHPWNCDGLRLRFFGKKRSLATIDTAAFITLQIISVALSVGSILYLEHEVAQPANVSLFSANDLRNQPREYFRLFVEGNLVVLLSGSVVYAWHRWGCLLTWVKTLSIAGIAGLYLPLICVLPVLIGVMFTEVPELRELQAFEDIALHLVVVSPFGAIGYLLGEMPIRHEVTLLPFYLVHGFLLIAALLLIRRRRRYLRQFYLDLEADN